MSMPFGSGADDAEAWVDQWSASISARAAAATDLATRVSQLSATATGADGAVTVTVTGAGLMSDLRLENRATRLSGPELAAEIMSTMRRAQRRLTELVAQVTQETVGLDSETGRAVLAGFERRFPGEPAVPDDPDNRGSARAW